MKKKIYSIIVLLALFIISSCDNSGDGTVRETDYSSILENTGNNVILNTYESLADKAAELQIATDNLEANPTQINLENAKAAWVATRSPWEQSEGFLFGPVDQEGLDPSLDSWPVNVTDLNNVLNSASELTPEFLSQQEGTLKGFHTIEFLLWGENGNKEVAEFSTREFEYLAAASAVLASDAKQLFELWSPSSGNFISNILEAGNGSKIYISQKSALEEITNALIIIADEVGNGKINDPFSQEDLTLEESRFSANSKADFSDNIRSIQNIYTGKFGTFGNGSSVSELISNNNPDLNSKVNSEIVDAIQAIETIPGTFSDAVFNNKTAVSVAQSAVRQLQLTLESEVLPIISNL